MCAETPKTDCPTCQGKGYNHFFVGDDDVQDRFGEPVSPVRTVSRECPDCDGTGKAI